MSLVLIGLSALTAVAGGGPQASAAGVLDDQVQPLAAGRRRATATPTATVFPPTATVTAVPPTDTPTATLTATAIPATATPTATSTALPSGGSDPILSAVIYEDSLAAGWTNWSWGSVVNFADGSRPYTGSRAIAWQVTQAWGGLYLHVDAGLDTTGASALSMALQATQAGQKVAVQLYDDQNNAIGSATQLSGYGGDPPVGSWRRYDLPLSVLGGLNRRINGVVVQDQTGQAQPVMYVDRVGLTAGAAASPTPTATPSGDFRRGVNLAGAEFGTALPGTYGVDYTYPTATELDYYLSKGLTLIRLPFRWERLQRSLYGTLDSTELGRLDAVVAAAHSRGMKLILDPHNYARYNGQLIGSTAVPNAAFADFWTKVASHYSGESAVWAYGLVNEPHDTGGLWPAAAQASVDAIRAVDSSHLILAPGDAWSGAWSWQQNNNGLNIRDPANNLMYEAHQYFDHDSSGTYSLSYDAEGAYPTIGVDRAKPFVDWLKSHGARGLLGEYGIPDNDSRWLTVLDNFLGYLDANGMGGTYWAGGPW